MATLTAVAQGAMTLCITTFGIMTLSLTTPSMMIFSITTFSIKGLFATVSITTFSPNVTQHTSTSDIMLNVAFAECYYAVCRYAEYHHAECRGAVVQ